MMIEDGRETGWASGSALESRIKFRHVRCFLQVARLRSVQKAAQALGISQPAASKTLIELEGILGVQLVRRGRREAVLTVYGEAFFHHAAASVVAMRDGIEGLAQLKGRGAGTLHIGGLPTVAAHFLPEAVERFQAEGGDVVVHLVTGPNRYLLDRLRLGELDLVVGRLAGSEQMADLAFVHLYSEEVRVIVRRDHPLLASRPPDLTRLRDFTVLLPDAGAVIRPAVDRLLIAMGVSTPPRRIETVSNAFGRAYVRRTDAVWIISHGVVAQDLEEGTLTMLDLDTSDTKGPVGLTTRSDQPASPALTLFMNAVRAVAAGRRAPAPTA